MKPILAARLARPSRTAAPLPPASATLRLCAALATCVAATAQGPATLVTDLNPFPALTNPSSNVEVHVQVGTGPFLLTASHPAVGREPWIVGSTGLGARLLTDIRPGAADSAPGEFTRVGGLVFFTADDGTHGRELWVTDGTATGTRLVEDVLPGRTGAEPRDLAEFQGRLWFSADDGQNGRELWTSDGSAAGTALFASTMPGAGSGTAHLMTVVNNRLFFAADSPAGRELWRSDGTVAGTALVRDIHTTGSSQPLHLTAAGNLLFFTAITAASGRELWRSDGTSGGTFQLLDIVGGVGSSEPRDLTAMGSRVLFTATTSAIGRELWTANGSLGGTSVVRDVWPGLRGSEPAELTVDPWNTSGRVYFAASHPSSGRELWRTDGSSAGTTLVADLRPGSLGAEPSAFAVVGTGFGTRQASYLWFSADDGTTGHELWRSRGTASTTTRIADLRPGAGSSFPDSIVQVDDTVLRGGWVLFRANDGTGGFELWRSNGSASGTSMTDLAPPIAGSTPREFVALGDRALFVGDDGIHGSELWSTDGTAAGTVLVRDIVAGPGGAAPADLVVWNGMVFFSASDATSGRELWRTDGTTAGTVLVRDLEPGAGGSDPGPGVPFRGALHFAATTTLDGRELFRTDGTSGNTRRIADVDPGSGSSSPEALTVLGSRLLFTADDGTTGRELWRYTGSSTARVLDIEPGSGGSAPAEFVVLGTRVLFSAHRGGEGRELWSSDGTATRTGLVADLRAGTSSSSPAELTVVEFAPGAPIVCFTATTASTGRELFASDGTNAGTRLVRDVFAGVPDSGLRHLTRVQHGAAGDVLMFAADDGQHGLELWRSSGSAASTTRLTDIAPGARSGLPGDGGFVIALPGSRQVVFAASDGLAGLELWRHDVVTGTTVLHQDIAPGAFGSAPSRPVLAGAVLVLAADDGTNGREPWRMAGPAIARPFGQGCAGRTGVPRLAANDAPFSGNTPFALVVTGAPAGGGTFLLLGIGGSTMTFGPCSLLVTPVVAFGRTADGGGIATFTLGVPTDPALVGARLLTQGAVVDPPAPVVGAIALTNGVEILIGPN